MFVCYRLILKVKSKQNELLRIIGFGQRRGAGEIVGGSEQLAQVSEPPDRIGGHLLGSHNSMLKEK